MVYQTQISTTKNGADKSRIVGRN